MIQSIDTDGLYLRWTPAPWDQLVTGYPVWQIDEIQLKAASCDSGMREFEEVRDSEGVGLVSCRLNHENLDISSMLERFGFRFIEMVYQPVLGLDKEIPLVPVPDDLIASPASEEDIPAIAAIAGSAFSSERFHVDPYLGPHLGKLRYRNWAKSSINHPAQRLLKIEHNKAIVAFFVTEMLPDHTCYWHLNAVSPKYQGQGLGYRCWSLMLRRAADDQARRVKTSVVARNHRVINLYSRLGFRFAAPSMTFHWTRDKTT